MKFTICHTGVTTCSPCDPRCDKPGTNTNIDVRNGWGGGVQREVRVEIWTYFLLSFPTSRNLYDRHWKREDDCWMDLKWQRGDLLWVSHEVKSNALLPLRAEIEEKSKG